MGLTREGKRRVKGLVSQVLKREKKGWLSGGKKSKERWAVFEEKREEKVWKSLFVRVKENGARLVGSVGRREIRKGEKVESFEVFRKGKNVGDRGKRAGFPFISW